MFELGGGPVVGVGPSMTRWMSERLLRKAKEGEIAHQVEIMAGHNGTNAWHMQTIREGIATTVLSLPLKYMHSPFETLQPEDIEQTARLLAAFVRGIETEGGLRPC
ncbi:hypothetical protein SDC9_182287 [bioreactor metagenome]|uniref:Aminopeptidase YsdC n=1 Tax=bioreactor metagenome TaxID=1076179 RepID=A0A645HGI9_9ZZZZ